MIDDDVILKIAQSALQRSDAFTRRSGAHSGLRPRCGAGDCFEMQLAKNFRANADARDAIPIGMILAIALISALWNIHARIDWGMPLAEVFLIFPMPPLALAFFYTTVRVNKRISEGALFIALWLFYGVSEGRLSYLGMTFNFPLQDAALARADSVLGFDWRMWCDFASSNDWFWAAQYVGYNSFFYQPLVSAAILAWCCAGRNRETLTAAIIALTATIIIGCCLPAFGPGHAYGIPAPWDGTMVALRSGARASMGVAGLISFPSFHATLALLMALAHRDIKSTRWPFFALNLLMVISVPLFGDHYLVDALGGLLVGMCSFSAARWILRNVDVYFSSLGCSSCAF